MKITVTVVFPVTFTVEEDLTEPLEEIREALKDYADEVFQQSSISPIIIACPEAPQLVE